MTKILLLSVLSIGLACGLAEGLASASVLCKANENPCAAENTIEDGETLILLSTNAVLTTSLTTVTCNSAMQMFVITDTGGEGKPVKGVVAGGFGIGYEGCKPSGFGMCSISGGGGMGVEFEGSGGNGSMRIGYLNLQASCGSPSFTCSAHTAGPVEYQVTGGSPATVVPEAIPLTGFTSPCSNGPTLHTALKSSSPKSLYIVDGPVPEATRLCKTNTNPCPSTSRHPIGSTIEASLEGKSQFEFLYEGKAREPACEGGSLTGKTTAGGEPLLGELTALSFSSCGGGVCAVEAQSLPYKTEIQKTTGGNGTMTLISGGGGSPKIEVNCGAAFKCIYKAASVSLTATGGSPAKLSASATLEKDAASQAECGSTMTWKATYKLTKPTGALYVTS